MKEISCEFCRIIFLPKKKSVRFCSKRCACKSRGGFKNHGSVNWSEVHRKAYSEGRNFVAGGTSKWYEYGNLKVQGTYELRTCKILDEWIRIGKIKEWKYAIDRISYVGIDGKIHTYIIDFTVNVDDFNSFHIEVKGFSTDNDALKWEELRKTRELQVWTLDIIKDHEKAIG